MSLREGKVQAHMDVDREKKIVNVEEPVKKSFIAEGGSASLDKSGQTMDNGLRMNCETDCSKGVVRTDLADDTGKSQTMELNGTEFMGRTIKIDNATPDSPAKSRGKDANFDPKTDTVENIDKTDWGNKSDDKGIVTDCDESRRYDEEEKEQGETVDEDGESLPKYWATHVTDKGEKYYCNKVTKESAWYRPTAKDK